MFRWLQRSYLLWWIERSARLRCAQGPAASRRAARYSVCRDAIALISLATAFDRVSVGPGTGLGSRAALGCGLQNSSLAKVVSLQGQCIEVVSEAPDEALQVAAVPVSAGIPILPPVPTALINRTAFLCKVSAGFWPTVFSVTPGGCRIW